MTTMSTSLLSLPPNQAAIARLATADSIVCYRILLQCVGASAKGPMYDAFDVGIDGKPANRLVGRSRTPALDVARIFAGFGMNGCIEAWLVDARALSIFVDISRLQHA
jgi:hypothetical protein